MESKLIFVTFYSLINFVAAASIYDYVNLDRSKVTIALIMFLIIFGGMLLFWAGIQCKFFKTNISDPDYKAVACVVVIFIIVAVLLYLNLQSDGKLM